MKQADDNAYTFQVATDNDEKRISLLLNEVGQPQYKSIFVKQSIWK
ncbi:hypothetical protein [Planococcus halocryophilus]|nr:hypothetical protein [Planococcus halocryophilus]